MDRRTFLASAAALVAMPPLPTSAGAVTETYATCPAGFALRSWSQDGRSYKAVVPVQWDYIAIELEDPRNVSLRGTLHDIFTIK